MTHGVHDSFQAADDQTTAQRELDRLTQGNRPVPEYSARFQEIAGRTGLSDIDLISRFKNGLSSESRLWFGMATLISEPKTLAEVVKLANSADFKMRSAQGKLKEPTPAQRYSPARDPFAMEIDATRSRPGPSGRTREDYLQAMRGRCFGCGSKDHVKKDGNHSGVQCRYCSRQGHLEQVCQDKFMGFTRGRGAARNQRVAASSTPFSLFNEDAPAPSPPSAPSSSSDLAQLQAAITQQTQLLAALTNNQSF